MSAFKRLKSSAIAALVLSGVSVTASAGWEELAGAAAGAGIGNRFGGGNGKTIATVAGGVAGYEVGGALSGNRSAPQYSNNAYRSGGNVGNPGIQNRGNQRVSSNSNSGISIGTIAGGVVGAVIGNRFGGGNGKILTTVLGGVGGAMIGKSMTEGSDSTRNGQLVMRDYRGHEWVNGTQPMDPVTEEPTFKREVQSVQDAYLDYAETANRFATARADLDWGRITQVEYNKYQNEAAQTSRNFERARNNLWNMASTVAVNYDKKIDDADLLVIAACNAVPAFNRSVDMAQIMEAGADCANGNRQRNAMR